MRSLSTPPEWGKAWSLYRRTTGTDSAGDPTAVYDMEHPDFTAQAGEPGAVLWQVQDGATEVAPFGEQVTAIATGRLFGAEPEIAPFDRVHFDGALWEVRSVAQWPQHRKVTVVQL